MTADRRAALFNFGFATGDYTCRCADCGLQFLGAKRSWRCFPCADAAEIGRAHTDDKRAFSQFVNSERRAALVERVAEELWQADSVRAVGTRRAVPWAESGARDQWLPLATAAIALIRAETLEEAARECERIAREEYGMEGLHEFGECAAAIRALKD